MIYHVEKRKDKVYIIISIDAPKAFGKNSTSICDKPLTKVDIEGIYLNRIKAIYYKPTANIIVSGEKLKSFLLNSE